METVVLPAQDHLAQERYRHQGGVMSGMVYPLGGLPRTRRKVRSPQQVFVAASLHSEIARSSDSSNVHVADSRSGLVSSMDMSLGVLRRAPSSHLPPLSVLKTPQYRLNNTTPHGFTSHESSSKQLQQQQQQLAASFTTQTGAPNSTPTVPRQILRTRSDGELLQQQGPKRVVDDRKKALEKGAESSKNSVDRKGVEKNLEKNAEKSSDRRKGMDRRPVEKKPSIGLNSNNQGDKSNTTVQKKTGVITILQRPQTKEAAAENIALFTGRPIEDVTKRILMSAQAVSQPLVKQASIEASTAVEVVKDAEVTGKDGDVENVQSRSSRNVSPKKAGKKKPSRDFSGKAALRAGAEGAQAESRRSLDVEFHGESRRPKSAPRPADGAQVDRRRSDDAERYAVQNKTAVELRLRGSVEPDVDEVSKSIDREFTIGHVSPSSEDQSVSNWYSDGVSTVTGVLHRGSSDSLVGEIGQAFARQGPISRSGSFRDVSRGNDNSVELFFLPSSPPKPSERWAGPAYTNSPPPSTLPFPTFPLQRVKTSMTEVTLADVVMQGPRDTNVEFVSSSAPSSPTRVGSLFFSATAIQSPFVDPSSATKDLRRILNLDVEDGFDVSAEWSEGGVESATQSLKRMLQLG